jgi:hypothetical protein
MASSQDNSCFAFRFVPIATQRQLSIGKEAGAIGSVLYSRKDGPVKNISDVRDKRVGVGQILAHGSFGLGFQVAIKKGTNLIVWHAHSLLFRSC